MTLNDQDKITIAQEYFISDLLFLPQFAGPIRFIERLLFNGQFLPLTGVERPFFVAFQFGLEQNELRLFFCERVGTHIAAVSETTEFVN